MPVGTMENLEDLAAKLGCGKGNLPTTYLGLPLGMKSKSTQMWDGEEERFRKKLALWKRQYISVETTKRELEERIPCVFFIELTCVYIQKG